MKKVGLLFGSFDPIHNGHLQLAQTAKKEIQLDEVWFVVTASHPVKARDSDDEFRITLPIHRINMVALALGFTFPKNTVPTTTHFDFGEFSSLKNKEKLNFSKPAPPQPFIMAPDSDHFNSPPELLPMNIEFHLQKPNYTHQTLKELIRLFKNVDFFPILGLDTYISLSIGDWQESKFILNNFKILIYQRDSGGNSQIKRCQKNGGLKLEIRPQNNLSLQTPPHHQLLTGPLLSHSSTEVRKLLSDSDSSTFGDYLCVNVLKYIRKNKLYTPQ